MKTIPQGFISAEEMHTLEIGLGAEPMSAGAWEAALLALGYALDRKIAISSTIKMITGELAGVSYPARHYGLKHVESKMSAFHVDCPRPNWEAVGELRRKTVLSKNKQRLLSV